MGLIAMQGCLLEALVYSKHDELLRAKSSDYPCLLTLVLAVLDVFLPHKEDGHDRSLEALLPLIRKQVKRPMKEGKVSHKHTHARTCTHTHTRTHAQY